MKRDNHVALSMRMSKEVYDWLQEYAEDHHWTMAHANRIILADRMHAEKENMHATTIKMFDTPQKNDII